MIIYPAVDILDGKCVRLFQGRLDAVKVYYEKPVDAAKNWESKGAEYLHIVDLNGAVSGEPKNIESVEEIIKSVNIPVQLGGGIRDLKSINKIFEIGVERAILGTSIINAPEFVAECCMKFGKKIIASIDAKNGKVAISGWKDGTEYDSLEIIKELKVLGVSKLVYTDISYDGTLYGVNTESVGEILKQIDIPVIVSGGVSSIDDIKNIKKMKNLGVDGVIIGTALYEKKLDLEEAVRVAKSVN